MNKEPKKELGKFMQRLEIIHVVVTISVVIAIIAALVYMIVRYF